MPFGSFASVVLVGCMWYMGVPLGVCVFVRRECQLVTPVSQKRGEVFEEFVGEVDGHALLSSECVVFFSTHGAFDSVPSLLAIVISGL